MNKYMQQIFYLLWTGKHFPITYCTKTNPVLTKARITSGAWTSYSVFNRVRVAQSFVLCIVFCRSLFVPFFLLTIALCVHRFTTSDYPLSSNLINRFRQQEYFCNSLLIPTLICVKKWRPSRIARWNRPNKHAAVWKRTPIWLIIYSLGFFGVSYSTNS